jgi:ribonuclease HII
MNIPFCDALASTYAELAGSVAASSVGAKVTRDDFAAAIRSKPSPLAVSAFPLGNA